MVSRFAISALAAWAVWGAVPAWAAGTVPEGGTCQITEYPQKVFEADKSYNPKLEIYSATCQRTEACEKNAPMVTIIGSSPTKGRIHQFINSGGCDEDAGFGCCIYFKVPEAPPEAVTISPGSSMKIDNPLGTTSILVVISRLAQGFLGIAGALAFFGFVYAGIVYMTAGDSDRVSQARDTMKYTIIGLAIITLAYAAISFGLSAISAAAR